MLLPMLAGRRRKPKRRGRDSNNKYRRLGVVHLYSVGRAPWGHLASLPAMRDAR